MILLVDSGSSKADWVEILPDGHTNMYTTQGINPSTQDQLPDVSKEQTLISIITKADKIYFYAAGVIHDESRDRIINWLQTLGAQGKIFVESDMVAAARACCGNNWGIVSILGTGSNSCVYDGNSIVDNIPSLGYILGDEGSGSHIGKEILRSYFCRKMPKQVADSFESNFQITRLEVIEQVYRKNKGSGYIASFAKWLEQADESWKKEVLNHVFSQFILYRLLPLSNQYKALPVHFVGSIAYNYKSYLTESLKDFGIFADKIIQKPIFALIDFHFKQNYQ